MDYSCYYQRLRGDMGQAFRNGVSLAEIQEIKLLRQQYWFNPTALDNIQRHLQFLLYSSQRNRLLGKR